MAIEGIPDSSKIFAHYNLGSMYERKGDYKETIDKFETALTLEKGLKTLAEKKLSGNAHFHLGCIYQSLGEREKAKGEFRACLKLVPNHKKARESIDCLTI
ncbi:tetratricopeptide repeat protein [bacterium]|nr:tetratricopeptide repeat protein [bacterium]